MTVNFYPPGESGRPSSEYISSQRCKNGHRWEARMFDELGGSFYVNEDEAYCPKCHQEDELLKRR